MLAALSSFSALLSATLFIWLGTGLLSSLLGLKLAQAGSSPLLSALVMTGYYAGLVAGARLCTNIIRRVGHIRGFAAFCTVNVITTLMLTLSDAAGVWIALRFFTGVSMMGTYMVIESWLNERADANMRGRVFGTYMLISYTGLGGSQFLLGFGTGNSQTLFTVGAILLALCLLPVVLTRAVVPAPVEQSAFNLRQLFDKAPHAIYGCLAAGITTGSFYALGPVYAFNISGNTSLVGAFMGLTIFGGLILQWPLGLLSDRFKRRQIMWLLGITLASVSLLLPLANGSLVGLLCMAALWGGFAFTLYPVAVAYANDRIHPQDMVPAAGVLLTVYSVGAAIGPLLSGLAIQAAGPAGLYLTIAINGLMLAMLLSRRRGAKRVSVEGQGEYLPVPNSTTVIAQLDPRFDEDGNDMVVLDVPDDAVVPSEVMMLDDSHAANDAPPVNRQA